MKAGNDKGAGPDAARRRLRNVAEWGIILAGFGVGTLLWIPSTRPAFLTPAVEPASADAVAEQSAAPAPRKPRPTGKLRVLYEVNPPMHPDDVAKLERAKQYMELQYGLENPVEIGIQPQSAEVCGKRAGEEEVARCRRGYRVTVTLVRE